MTALHRRLQLEDMYEELLALNTDEIAQLDMMIRRRLRPLNWTVSPTRTFLQSIHTMIDRIPVDTQPPSTRYQSPKRRRRAQD